MSKMPTGSNGPVVQQVSQPKDPESVLSRDLAKIRQDAMPSIKSAREFLEKQGYAPVDTQGNRASMAYTLLLLAH